jgi:homoserine kinase type II
MAVYTEVSFDDARAFLANLHLGELEQMEGCAGGIENTNYFVTTDRAAYVLTLFERLSAQQLPFYLRLMKHLAGHGIAVPDPVTDPQGNIVHSLRGKPAAVVNRLRGSSELHPTPLHCAELGTMLARMHLAAGDFSLAQPHMRGLAWWNETAPIVQPFLNNVQADLLQSELAYQNHIAAQSAYLALKRGAIHADLFRDNVMFDGSTTHQGRPTLSGIFDFYFAGVDTFLFDIAVCLNDWCVDLADGVAHPQRTRALLDAYDAVRKLTAPERQLLPAMTRAAAMRFWISRLWDLHLPRQASMLKPHDPGHFERVLLQRLRHPLSLAALESITGAAA